MKKYIFILFLFLIGMTTSWSQQRAILLKGATAHLGNGQVIENSVIGFEKGILTVVSNSSEPLNEADFEVVDVTGKHIYPGFILPNSPVGLEEVSAIRAMSDSREEGSFNPNVRSIIAYNTDSEYIPTFRFNGVLLAETTPQGGVISGTSSVVKMDGWNWEDAVHDMDIGIHLNFPRRMLRKFDYSTFTVKKVPNKKYEETIASLKDFFAQAKAYQPGEDVFNLKLEALRGLFDGSKRLFLHAGGAKEIIEGIRFAQEQGVEHITLIASSEVLYVADFIKENEIPLIIPATQRVPENPDRAIDLPYELPHLLAEKGIEVGLSSVAMLGNARNLPFFAGTAAAYGMDKETALQTITLNTAKALGIDDKVGSLEKGKHATLFVSEGDALDYHGNKLLHAFIDGKEIELKGKQQELYERFSRKYGHQK